nr:MAG TPA: hypothetical protein [Bacteriophage sp.]
MQDQNCEIMIMPKGNQVSVGTGFNWRWLCPY